MITLRLDISPRPGSGKKGPLTPLATRYVVWAAGEFQYPKAPKVIGKQFPGFELCIHNSSVRSSKDITGDNFVVIGGYESGMDAACNFSACGKCCTVVSSTECWSVVTDDPSTELAPHTLHRVRCALSSSFPPRLLAPLRVFKVELVERVHNSLECKSIPGEEASAGMHMKRRKLQSGPTRVSKIEYIVHAKWGASVEHTGGEHRLPLRAANSTATLQEKKSVDTVGKEGTEIILRTSQPPLLCTGFGGSVSMGAAKELFEYVTEDEVVAAVTNDDDQKSTCATKVNAAEDDNDEKSTGATKIKDGEDEENAKEDAGSGCGVHLGSPKLTSTDESTITPGLFLVGSLVRHGALSFCFVYKFRQRFGVVADAIARGLGRETRDAVEKCREMDMFMDDFESCKDACGDTC